MNNFRIIYKFEQFQNNLQILENNTHVLDDLFDDDD